MSATLTTATAPIPITTLHDPAYFERLAAVEFTHWWPAGMWRIVEHWLDRGLRGRSDLQALDIGCGTGSALIRLEGRPEIASALGIDASESALGLARRRSDRLCRADAFALPFADGTFDIITCFDVWQHLPGDLAARSASELRRVLRPGGLALIRANGRGLWPGRRVGVRLYRVEELAATLRASGLDVLRATYANSLPSIAQEILGRLRSAPDPVRPSHPAGGGLCLRLPPPWLNRLMGRVSSCEAFAAGRLGIGLPVGHSTMALAVRPTGDGRSDF